VSDSKALAIIPRSLPEVQSLAEVLAKSDLLPAALKGKVPDVIVQILAGQELGLAPMASIRGVHVVDGKPILSADTMVALVRGSGLCEYFICVEDTSTLQTYETKRNGDPQPQRMTFTMDDAKRAAVHMKDNWRLYPRSMLKARAKAMLARDVYPDVLAGVYDPDEIQVPASHPPTPVVREPVPAETIEDAEIVDVPELATIDACETVDQLKALSKSLAALKGPAKQIARERYSARLKQLEAAATTPMTETAA
jgi:hypothetical protein